MAGQDVERYPRGRDRWQVAGGSDVDVLAEEIVNGNGGSDGAEVTPDAGIGRAASLVREPLSSLLNVAQARWMRVRISSQVGTSDGLAPARDGPEAGNPEASIVRTGR